MKMSGVYLRLKRLNHHLKIIEEQKSVHQRTQRGLGFTWFMCLV